MFEHSFTQHDSSQIHSNIHSSQAKYIQILIQPVALYASNILSWPLVGSEKKLRTLHGPQILALSAEPMPSHNHATVQK